jgi:predicted esterase
MKYFYLLLTGLAAFVFSGCSSTNETISSLSGQHSEQFSKTVVVNVDFKYLLYLPKDYFTQKKQWPLILFLHGSGERGTDIEAVKRNGLPKILDGKDDFPFIVVSPLCPSNEDWYEGWTVNGLNALLNQVIEDYNIDTNRVYVTGLSMGGFGTWALAEEYPQKFAAIAPVSGGGDEDKVCNLHDVSVWAFHGADDNVVPIANEQLMVNTLKQCGGDVTYTIYPNTGHDAWTATYNNPKLYDWFLSHTRKIKKLIKVERDEVQASSGNAYNAFDGSFDSRWESEWKDPQWITIDFKKQQNIKAITIFWVNAFGKEYEILASNDNEDWKHVYTQKNFTGGTDKISFDNLESRYLKFNFIHRGTQWGYSIWEMEIE